MKTESALGEVPRTIAKAAMNETVTASATVADGDDDAVDEVPEEVVVEHQPVVVQRGVRRRSKGIAR